MFGNYYSEVSYEENITSENGYKEKDIHDYFHHSKKIYI